MIWFINVAGLLLIALIVWWFWLYRPKGAVVLGNKPLKIMVADGVYQPAWIELPANQKTDLEFVRKDASPCAEIVVFPALGISADLSLNKSTKIQLPALQPGNYEYHCQMRMYRGELKVV